MSLQALVFSELFVAHSIEWSWYKATPDASAAEPIPPDCVEEVKALRTRLEGTTDFRSRVWWPNADGFPLRVTRKRIEDDLVVFVCRRHNLDHLSLEGAGLSSAITKLLMKAGPNGPSFKNGIVAILGRPGAGKTTLAAAFMLDRLRTFGGTAWTIECPPELQLQGRHGPGNCYQIGVTSDNQIGDEVEALYTAMPNIVFIGEIRNRAAALAAVRAAGSGYLCILTYHANDLLSGLSQFARATAGDVAFQLADVLRVAIHVELHNSRPPGNDTRAGIVAPNAKGTGTPPRILSVQPLFMLNDDDALRSTVRAGDFHLLASEVDRQKRNLMADRPISDRPISER